jgi:glycogen debranching enzyme
MQNSHLRTAATAILRENDRGDLTVPSSRLYPHQWNWDSAFNALGWGYIDPRRAARELASLGRGQWKSGMIPHIIFDPAVQHYEPSPAVWQTQGAPGAPGVPTSSITQPPMAAVAAWRLLQQAGDDAEVRGLLSGLVPVLDAWHRWFVEARDPAGDGLPGIVHPWESGMDNAPRWDRAMARLEPGAIEYRRVDDGIVDASQRPTRGDYDRYIFLVRQRALRGLTGPVSADEPFLVCDVALISILVRAEEELASLAAALGQPELAAAARQRGQRLAAAMNTHLFDAGRGVYADLDRTTGALLPVAHVASLLPIFSGGVPAEPLAGLVEGLQRFDAPWPVPTVPLDEPGFEGRRYWRGPTWVNVNWLLADGLERAGHPQMARTLAGRTLELVERNGFFEYFDPQRGEGLGSDRFSWTAALVLDILARWV